MLDYEYTFKIERFIKYSEYIFITKQTAFYCKSKSLLEERKMPQGDKTGPQGQGPMTGRRMGLCNGYPMPGFMNMGCRMGFGRGMRMGFRRGMRIPFVSPMPMNQPVELSKEDQKKILQAELKELESEKSEIEKELKDIKSN